MRASFQAINGGECIQWRVGGNIPGWRPAWRGIGSVFGDSAGGQQFFYNIT